MPGTDAPEHPDSPAAAGHLAGVKLQQDRLSWTPGPVTHKAGLQAGRAKRIKRKGEGLGSAAGKGSRLDGARIE